MKERRNTYNTYRDRDKEERNGNNAKQCNEAALVQGHGYSASLVDKTNGVAGRGGTQTKLVVGMREEELVVTYDSLSMHRSLCVYLRRSLVVNIIHVLITTVLYSIQAITKRKWPHPTSTVCSCLNEMWGASLI